MAYIDQTYYTNNGGKAEDYSSAFAQRVSDLVDSVTFLAVQRFSLEGTMLFDRVKKAVLAQMLFVVSEYGGQAGWESDEQMKSENMGNYSYTRNEQGGRGVYDGLALVPNFLSILAPVIAIGRQVG